MGSREGGMSGVLARRALVAGALLAFSAFLPSAAQAPPRSSPDSGGLAWVRVGGGRIRIRILGTDTPTVVLVSGLGDGLRAWAAVQPAVATFARVLAYDRPGLGASDPTSGPRDVAHMAVELNALLTQADAHPPYILVGHSLGGMIVQVYAAHHPHDVAGIVLIDPALAGFYLRADSLPAWQEELAKENRDLVSAPAVVRAEMAAFADDVSAVAALGPLPTVPMGLLTSTHHGVEGPGAPALEQLWLHEHRRWAADHPGTRHLVDSVHGHRLQEETPGDVSALIRSIVEEALHRSGPQD